VGWGPGDGDSIVALYLVQEGIYAGDDLLVGNRFDGAGCKQFDTVETVRYKIVTRCEDGVERCAPSPDPVQSMVEGAEFPRVAGGAPSPNPVGPQIARISALSGKVMWTPHPAEPFGRAEPSVKINAEGLSSKGSPGPVDLDMYSSAFFRVVNRFTSAGIPTV